MSDCRKDGVSLGRHYGPSGVGHTKNRENRDPPDRRPDLSDFFDGHEMIQRPLKKEADRARALSVKALVSRLQRHADIRHPSGRSHYFGEIGGPRNSMPQRPPKRSSASLSGTPWLMTSPSCVKNAIASNPGMMRTSNCAGAFVTLTRA
jgi:hypothetical protein